MRNPFLRITMPGKEKHWIDNGEWNKPASVSAKEKNELSTKAGSNIVGQTERYPQDETDK